MDDVIECASAGDTRAAECLDGSLDAPCWVDDGNCYGRSWGQGRGEGRGEEGEEGEGLGWGVGCVRGGLQPSVLAPRDAGGFRMAPLMFPPGRMMETAMVSRGVTHCNLDVTQVASTQSNCLGSRGLGCGLWKINKVALHGRGVRRRVGIASGES